MNIDQDIQTAIKSHLPAQVGEVLRQRLTQADTLEKQLLDANRSIEQYTKLWQDADKKVADQGVMEAREKKISEREAAVISREQICALNEVRLECAKERVADLKEVTLAVFGNAKYKYSEIATVPVALPGHSPGNGNYGVSPSVVKETATREVSGEGTPPAASSN